MKEVLLCKYGEIVLKGANKTYFEDILCKELRKRAKRCGNFEVSRAQSTVYVEPLDDFCDMDAMLAEAQKVFGIVSIARAYVCEKSLESISEVAREYIVPETRKYKTFKVEAKRSDKRFPLDSMELSREIGGVILSSNCRLKVDVRNPEVLVKVEVRERAAYIYAGHYKGAGGMPVGTNGKGLLLLSGGIDSPVAGHMIAKRGVTLEAVHFESFPYTSERALQKVLDLAKIVSDYSGDIAAAHWETIDFAAEQNTVNWDMTTVEGVEIPSAYMGDKNVVIAFRYIGTEAQAGTFEVDNVALFAAAGSNDGEGSGGDEGGNEGGNEGEDGGNEGGTVGNGGNFTSGSFTLVTDAAQLTIGDSIVIAYENFAMGQSAGNYRDNTDIMVSNNTITYLSDDVQVVLLEEGVVEGTFAFNVGDGYLAATSSSSNHIVTSKMLDENGSWGITIDSDALAVVVAQGDKTRNVLQYNVSSPRFSCYRGNQKPVTIYAKSPVGSATGIGEVESENGNAEAVYDLTGRSVNSAAVPGIYIIGGKKVLVK